MPKRLGEILIERDIITEAQIREVLRLQLEEEIWNLFALDEGEFSDGVVPRGKQAKDGPRGTRQGLNDFTGWFSGDPDMEGRYFGYDGPAPPWNDSIIHHYVFTIYALDVDRVDIEGEFTGPEVREAIQGHVLAEASLEGTYTQNPRLIP